MQTRLDVINDMIVSTGARPLLAAQSRHPMYLKADQVLIRVIASVLSMGLWFNTECRVLKAQTNGEVMVPQDCIKADPLDRNWNITTRQGKLYNLNTGTYEIGSDIRMRMYFNLDYEDIPLAGQEYIRAKGTYDFYLDENGADPKLSHYRAEKDQGWIRLWQEHIRSRKVNVFDNPNNIVTQLRKGSVNGMLRRF